MDIDAKKLDTAILYLQRISEGKNPVNNMPAEEDVVLNNPNVIRCMHFVKDILEEVKQNGGYVGRKPRKSDKAEFPLESLKTFQYQEDKAITKLVHQINDGIDLNKYQKLSYRSIQKWLILNEYLEEKYLQQFNKTFKVPTEKGLNIGIRFEVCINSYGSEYVLFSTLNDASFFTLNGAVSV